MPSLHTARLSFAAHAPIAVDLRAAGYLVDYVWDLNENYPKYRDALPILISWLPRVEDPDVKEAIARALGIRWARPVPAAALIREFRAVDDAGLRWVIGDSLSFVADDSVFDEVVEIAENRRWGSDRSMVVLALGNMKNPRAVEVLRGLLGDEEVTGHTLMALRKLRAKGLEKEIEPFLTHEKTWWRNEAKKLMAGQSK